MNEDKRAELSKAEQSELAWNWHLSPSLALVYGTFENYVAVVMNNRSKLNDR